MQHCMAFQNRGIFKKNLRKNFKSTLNEEWILVKSFTHENYIAQFGGRKEKETKKFEDILNKRKPFSG